MKNEKWRINSFASGRTGWRNRTLHTEHFIIHSSFFIKIIFNLQLRQGAYPIFCDRSKRKPRSRGEFVSGMGTFQPVTTSKLSPAHTPAPLQKSTTFYFKSSAFFHKCTTFAKERTAFLICFDCEWDSLPLHNVCTYFFQLSLFLPLLLNKKPKRREKKYLFIWSLRNNPYICNVFLPKFALGRDKGKKAYI